MGSSSVSFPCPLDDLKALPQKRFQVTFECCGNSPVPDYYTKSLRISSVMEQIKGHGIMGNAEWAGVSLRDVLEMAGVKDNAVEVMFEGRRPRAGRSRRRPRRDHL